VAWGERTEFCEILSGLAIVASSEDVVESVKYVQKNATCKKRDSLNSINSTTGFLSHLEDYACG